jgi:hypothetical protein
MITSRQLRSGLGSTSECLPSPGQAKLGILFLAVLVLNAAVGCKKASSTHEGGLPSTTTGSGSIHVSYRSNVHVLEQTSGIEAIQGVSTNGAGILLDASSPEISSVKAGDVLIIKGFLAKKILATQTIGSSILFLTQPADLLDAIQNGKISLTAPIRFHGSPVASVSGSYPGRLFDLLVPPVYAQSPESEGLSKAEAKGTLEAGKNILNGIKGAVIDDWDTDFNVTPADGRLNLHLKMTKSVGGFSALINGEGYLTDFDFDSDIGVEQSTYQKLETNLKNINGVMNFKWEVAKDSPGIQTGDDRIKLPAAIEVPLYRFLEGFPLFLEVSSAIIIKPAISGGSEYSRGAFRITYDGYQHFSAKKGNIDSDGNISGDIQFLESQNISPLAPMGMVVAFAAPRIELSFGISKIFKFKDLKEAAATVDQYTDLLAQKVLSADQYQEFRNSPIGHVSVGQPIDMAMKSDAAAYFEMVSSSGMSFSGMSAITPCTRHDIHLRGKVGVSAEAFGMDLGKAEKDVFKKDFTRIDPPGTHLCESVGTQ